MGSALIETSEGQHETAGTNTVAGEERQSVLCCSLLSVLPVGEL